MLEAQNEVRTDVWHATLSPLRYLIRSAAVWSGRPAVIDGDRSWTYAEHLDRVERLASVLRTKYGIESGERVATLLPNSVAQLELHYAVPGTGAVLVPLNTRLSPAEYAYILEHCGARLLVADRSLEESLDAILAAGHAPEVLWVDAEPAHSPYDALIAEAGHAALLLPADEDELLSINYTSGTTGRPKGVMTTHRGAYLHTLGVIAEAGLEPTSVYLWTLPMFHCNGWAYTWAVTAAGATHVCLRNVRGADMWVGITEQSVTHMCAAPTVLATLLGHDKAQPVERPLRVFVGGAPPAPALIARAETLGMAVTHLYGLTETYGPLAVCAWNPDWDALDPPAQSALRARQGVATVVTEPLRVVDGAMVDVTADGKTLGEVVMRGNNVMAGYFRDPEATNVAFAGGWFHSGDLAVVHPDGYIELRDRLKDVIISGGENISTIEVEQAMLAFPEVDEAAVVASPDERWGEVPVAYLTVRGGVDLDIASLSTFLRARIAHFKVPKEFHVLSELPKTGTGKIQKFVLRSQEFARTGHDA